MVVELAKQQTKAGVKEGVEEKAIIRTLYRSQNLGIFNATKRGKLRFNFTFRLPKHYQNAETP